MYVVAPYATDTSNETTKKLVQNTNIITILHVSALIAIRASKHQRNKKRRRKFTLGFTFFICAFNASSE